MAWLAGDVRAHIPGVGSRVEGAVRDLVDLGVPAGLTILCRLDRAETEFVEVTDAGLNPLRLQLSAEWHGEEHPWGTRTVDHEKVRETRDGHAQVVAEALRPLLPQWDSASALRVELEHRATDRVESGGEHQDVDRMLAV